MMGSKCGKCGVKLPETIHQVMLAVSESDRQVRYYREFCGKCYEEFERSWISNKVGG